MFQQKIIIFAILFFTFSYGMENIPSKFVIFSNQLGEPMEIKHEDTVYSLNLHNQIKIPLLNGTIEIAYRLSQKKYWDILSLPFSEYSLRITFRNPGCCYEIEELSHSPLLNLKHRIKSRK